MRTWLRKLLLAVHIAVSVAWIGAVVAYLPFDVVAATSADAERLRLAYLAMDLISRRALVPLALTSLGTGIVVSLATPWGLFRHYWVVISLLLTTFATIVLLVESRTIAYLADVAADPSVAAERIQDLGNTLVHSVGGLAVLLVVHVLNVYKPRGLTRYGWRKLQDERRLVGDASPPRLL